MDTMVAVPAPDALAVRYRTALSKMEGDRAQWIESTLEFAAVVLEARNRYPDHHAYSRWLERNNLQKLTAPQRSALLGFAKNPTAAREMLERHTSRSWRTIWEEVPKRARRAPSDIGKGPQQPFSRRSGASKRKRERRIPDVMRDDPPPSRPAVNLKGLTREQVDPDFKGTALEFATKYGHVNLQTKEQIAHHKQQEALMAWLGAVSEFERTGRAMLTAHAAVDAAVVREWMTKPGKAAKLRAWYSSIARVCEALRKIIET